MNILIAHPDFEELGGVANYYSKLQGKFRIPVQHFILGQRYGKQGILNRIYQAIADYCRFVRLLRRDGINLVHLNPSLDFKSFMRDGILTLTVKLAGIKAVVFFRGWKESCEVSIERYFLWLFKLFFGKADAFVVLSNHIAETLRRWGIVQPIYKEVTVIDDDILTGFNIHNGLKKRQGSEKWRVLFLARVTKQKGIYETVQAVSILQAEYPTMELVIAGDGEELENVKSFVPAHNVSNVTFLGYVKGEDKRRIFESSQVLCFPTSHGEGLPNSVVEAMAYGLPVVTRPVGGLADFFENGKHGFISDSLDPKYFANLIEELFLDKRLYERISLYNYQYAQSHFLASNAVSRLEKIYKEVLSGK